MGQVLNFPIHAALSNLSSSFNGTAPLQEGPWSAFLSTSVKASQALEIASPIQVSSVNYVGRVLNSYFNDYYNRIWVLPNTSVNFGEIGGLVQQSRTIWNTFSQPVTVTAINETETENVELLNLTVSTSIGRLATRVVQFRTNEQGPSQLEGFYDINFSLGGVKTINVSGRRSLPWPIEDFRVNWAEPYEVSMEFRTEIFVSRNGKEQRRAQRSTPRKTIEYSSAFEAGQLRRYNAILANRQTRTFTVPEETKTVKLSSAANQNTNVLAFEEVPNWVRPDFNYMLLNARRREVVQVESVSLNSVTLAGPLQNDWPEQTYLMPVHTARASTQIRAPRLTNGVATVSQIFEVLPTSEPYGDTSETYPLYEDLPVFLEKHNWSQNLEVIYGYEREELDYGKGLVRYYTPIDFSSQVRTLAFDTDEVSRSDRIRDFFIKRRGQREEFWLPTYENDFVLVQDVAPNTDRLRVKGRDIYDFYRDDKTYRNFIVFLTDGTAITRRIESMQLISDLNGEDTELEVTEVLPQGLQVSEVRVFSWLPRVRFATDILRQSWLTREVSRVTLSFRTLEDL
jgi:hypothetical protein